MPSFYIHLHDHDAKPEAEWITNENPAFNHFRISCGSSSIYLPKEHARALYNSLDAYFWADGQTKEKHEAFAAEALGETLTEAVDRITLSDSLLAHIEAAIEAVKASDLGDVK